MIGLHSKQLVNVGTDFSTLHLQAGNEAEIRFETLS